jgi:hypothetical protein
MIFLQKLSSDGEKQSPGPAGRVSIRFGKRKAPVYGLLKSQFWLNTEQVAMAGGEV